MNLKKGGGIIQLDQRYIYTAIIKDLINWALIPWMCIGDDGRTTLGSWGGT